MAEYSCDPKLHGGVMTPASYFIQGLRSLDDPPNEIEPAYRVDNGYASRSAATCARHLNHFMRWMFDKGYTNLVVRKVGRR